MTKTKSKAAASSPNTISAVEAARRIASGALTSQALVEACLARIQEREPAVHAWAYLDPDAALAQARAADSATKKAQPLGPLHGVPIGVKDIFDTSDMPTQMGSSIYKGYQSKTDAACVALARKAGAVILGKTVTCELAGIAPRETMNPHDPKRTPGGSSSGSAAAVADHMVPLALGTQTGGSVIRPASFCGIVGYKPTFNTINRSGMKFAAEDLDTIGLMARTVEDIALFADVSVDRPAEPLNRRTTPPRIGLCRNLAWDTNAQPETKAAVLDTAKRAAKAGAHVEDFYLGQAFADLFAERQVINDYQRACGLAWELVHHKEMLSPQMTRSVTSGLALPREKLVAMLKLAEHCRILLERTMARFDVLLTPSVDGEAPLGLDYAGNPAFQALWTLLHVPTITLPLAKGPNDMPVGVQLVARRWEDRPLLETAQWMMENA